MQFFRILGLAFVVSLSNGELARANPVFKPLGRLIEKMSGVEGALILESAEGQRVLRQLCEWKLGGQSLIDPRFEWTFQKFEMQLERAIQAARETAPFQRRALPGVWLDSPDVTLFYRELGRRYILPEALPVPEGLKARFFVSSEGTADDWVETVEREFLQGFLHPTAVGNVLRREHAQLSHAGVEPGNIWIQAYGAPFARQVPLVSGALRFPAPAQGTVRVYRYTSFPDRQMIARSLHAQAERNPMFMAPRGDQHFFTAEEGLRHSGGTLPEGVSVTVNADKMQPSGRWTHVVAFDVPEEVFRRLPMGAPELGERVFKYSIPVEYTVAVRPVSRSR